VAFGGLWSHALSGIVSSLRPACFGGRGDNRRFAQISGLNSGIYPTKLHYFCLISASLFRKCLRCNPRIRAPAFLARKSFVVGRPSRCGLHKVGRALRVRRVFQSCLQRSCLSWLMFGGVLFITPKNGTPTDTNGHQKPKKSAIISHHVTSSHIGMNPKLVARPPGVGRRVTAPSRCVMLELGTRNPLW
jgi:hypothetical protein